MMPTRLIRPFRIGDRALRLRVYSAAIFVCAIYIVFWQIHGDEASRFLRGLFYALIALFDYVGMRQLKEYQTNYRPAYKVEKGTAVVVFLGLGLSFLIDATGRDQLIIFGLTLILLSSIVAMEFILWRNRDLAARYVRTTYGLFAVPTRDEADRHIELSIAFVRHHLGSEERRGAQYEQLMEAFGVPPENQQAEKLRAQLAHRRASYLPKTE